MALKGTITTSDCIDFDICRKVGLKLVKEEIKMSDGGSKEFVTMLIFENNEKHKYSQHKNPFCPKC
mgnify:CR=1 FL=1